MLRFQRVGDSSAFRTLFFRHESSLLAYLRRIAERADVAEEVSQQAWLKIIEVARRGGFSESSTASFRTFLFTLARNHFVDRYVRAHAEARTAPIDDAMREVLADQDRRPVDDEVGAMQTTSVLHNAMVELPFEQRDVIALWSVGIDIDTIASLVGAPRDTVMSRKKYALARLKASLATHGITEA